MFYVEKTLTFAAAHRLNLPYQSKCNSLHGHEWSVTIKLGRSQLNKEGMVVDFKHVKNVVTDAFDHKMLNEEVPKIVAAFPPEIACQFDEKQVQYPTAELLCLIIRYMLETNLNAGVYRVEVVESEGSKAIWTI